MPGPTPRPTLRLLATARMLQRARLGGETRPLLRGKKFAVLVQAGSDTADSFRRAATELGAHVATVHVQLTLHSTAGDIEEAARMLGRLYDAVECHSMPAELVARLAQLAGVPVYNAVSAPDSPNARLATLLGGETCLEDNECFVLQALLVLATT